MRENHFDETIAATYDEDSPEMFEPELLDATVDVLAELAGEGRALELGDRHGAGRGAAGRARRARARASSSRRRCSTGCGPSRAPLTIEAAEGDMASTRVDGEFSLVYLVFNTITNLTTQDEQVACFAQRRRAPGARWVAS